MVSYEDDQPLHEHHQSQMSEQLYQQLNFYYGLYSSEQRLRALQETHYQGYVRREEEQVQRLRQRATR